ncbi:DUF4031 domain-containing protein [Nisaea sediminum]|uniref:DUF4031 domain-containing protein n=1 Tax=Nisaea sediminum TaxID=2775867 RepID=UPI0018674CF8|nr:DUF4031 domain-containing protein [Nisaea sediminum]
MPVYLDTARNRFRRMIMCHMIADTLDELHAMAERIGMRREWFQPRSFPHYDVCLTRRAVAIKHGATVLERRDFVAAMQRIRAAGGTRDDSNPGTFR